MSPRNLKRAHYMARIRVPNPQARLLVGMIAEARIVGDGQIDVLTLPGTSIVRDPQGATQVYVYFPNEKRVYARRVTVTAGITGPGYPDCRRNKG